MNRPCATSPKRHNDSGCRALEEVCGEKIKVDFVSDVVCRCCAIGLSTLEKGIAAVPGLESELNFIPFELNPDMPPAGEDAVGSLLLAPLFNRSMAKVAVSR